MKNGFTLIELLAVIIILAVIALIATPIMMDVIYDSKESENRSSVVLYADAIELQVTTNWFKSGAYPNVNKSWVDTNVEYSGNRVICEEVYYNTTNGVLLHKCTVGNSEVSVIDNIKVHADDKTYCYYKKNIYEKCEDDVTYMMLYNSIKDENYDSQSPSIGFIVDDGIINEDGWAKENFYVNIETIDEKSGIDYVKYCIDTVECTPSTLIDKSNANVLISGETDSNIICVEASDNSGNISNKCSNTFKLDKTNPTIEDLMVINIDSNSINVKVSATDNIKNYHYGLNDESMSSTQSDDNLFEKLSNFTEYNIKAYVEDFAGNISEMKSITATTGYVLSDYLLNPSIATSGLNKSTTYNYMYRYRKATSSIINNYVCLGVSNCSNTYNSNYLYRIIGIVNGDVYNSTLKNGMIKIIKATNYVPAGNKSQWNKTGDTLGQTDITWEQSQLMTDKLPIFYNDKNFVTDIAKTYIERVKWHTYRSKTEPTSGQEVSSSSNLTSTAYSYGLMYLNDYYNSYSGASSKGGWLHETNTQEWTISYYGSGNNGYYYAWRIYDSSGTNYCQYCNLYSPGKIRPVFYLNSNIKYVSGNGTIINPYIIA